MIKLEDVIVDYVENYLDGYARRVYAIDASYMGFSLTISDIILDDDLFDDIILDDDLFDYLEVKEAVYEQFKAGELEVIIHKNFIYCL